MREVLTRMQKPDADGCIYCREGVACRLPALYGVRPAMCRRCGWNPMVSVRRIERLRETMQRDWEARHGREAERKGGERA